MVGWRVHAIRAALACLLLLGFVSLDGALAQLTPSAAPATLRLAQVVVRLPVIHLYASAQDESGKPVAGPWSEKSALIGPNNAFVEIDQNPEGIGIVFLIDISRSLNQQQFSMITASVMAWVNLLGPKDRAAIVTLGSSVNTVQDFTDDKDALFRAVRDLAARDQQTLLYQGLAQAIDLSRRLDGSLPLRRAIVVLTDGLDDQQGGAGRQEVLDKLAVDPTPIYGLGASTRNNAKVNEALKNFAGLVRASGGDYRRIGIRSLNQAFDELQSIVSSTIHLTAKCADPRCAPDGSAIVVRLFMSQGGASLSSESVTVRFVGAAGEVQPPQRTIGLLAVRVSPPEAILSLDGRPAGPAADFRQEVSAGTHDLEISAAGYQSRQETVTVPAGGEKSMEFALIPLPTTGILALRGSPSAAVLSLDGKPAGPAANFRRDVSAGTHDLEISAAGYETRRETVTVPADGEKSVQFMLVEPPENWLRLVYKFFRALPLHWLIPLALFIGVSIPGMVIFLRRPKPKPPEPGPQLTTKGPVLPDGLSVSPKVLITTHTQQDKQRLRLYPIGRSDLGPFDLLFEETLAVGRSPDSEICISNDGQVSASHCALSPKGKFILVEDAGSRNGTRVNGVPINGFLHAEPESILGVGRTELRMKLLPVGAR